MERSAVGSAGGRFEIETSAGHEADAAGQGMYDKQGAFSSGGGEWMLIAALFPTRVHACV